MECPKCGLVMNKGYIPVGKMALMWIPEDEHPPLTVFGKTKNGVILSKVPVWSRIKVTSYHCKNCKFVLTPVRNLV